MKPLDILFVHLKSVFTNVTKHSSPFAISIGRSAGFIVEPEHDKRNKMTCAPSEDSDRLGRQPSLIRVFAVRMKKHLVFGYP